MTVDVDRVAQLSKLEILPEQKSRFEKQMNEIVNMADILLDVDDVAADDVQRFADLREDIVSPACMAQDIAANNAPGFKNGCFCVPKTVE
ncbi:MAG: Asp-tRNA(Asn)/Glu-tRNA(Gln) amidotransferase subunit GatC [Ruminococcus sp.]|nr:Asp-tRNA(Asn)/Glu-tRNA(Gln) amidotransferase subunit GatC [Ruminococcus sp.]MBR7009114.1 Asp-tRNA(Asn)/Glu-tRNA(Gln) amidotransferase subunit GatC [Ruminococcus sp.]